MNPLKIINPVAFVFTATIAGIVYAVFSKCFAVGVVSMVALAANVFHIIKNDK